MKNILTLSILLSLFNVNNVFAQCTVDAGEDVYQCDTVPVVLTATGGNGTFTWGINNGTLSCTSCPNPTVNTSAVATIWVSSSGTTVQNAINGDFSSGNTGFTSGYNYNATSIWNEGTYSVTTSANAVHPNFSAWGDHTTGSGNYMCVNGSSTFGQQVWCQAVPLPSNTSVTIQFWVLTLATPSPTFRIKVNGAVVANNITTSTTVGVWTLRTATFNSGSAATTNVCIESTSTASSGNDFGLDDISFQFSCSASDTLTVTRLNPQFMNRSQTNSTGCAPLCIDFSTSFAADPIDTILDYVWYTGDSTFSGSDSLSYCYTTPGAYLPKVEIITAKGCSYFWEFDSVKVFEGADLKIEAGDTLGCDSLCVQFVNNSIWPTGMNLTDWTWDFGDGNHLQAFSGNHCYTQPGNYTVTLTASDPVGCQFSTTYEKKILVSGSPESNFSLTPNYIPGDNSVIDMAASPCSGCTYDWEFGDGTIGNGMTVQHVYNADGVYTICLTTTNEYGCSSSTCKDLPGLLRIELSNVFSPNGDGINEYFRPNLIAARSVEWKVFDRWGQTIFETDQIDKVWDGTKNGNRVSDGVYMVYVKAIGYNGEQKEASGNVSVFH